MDFSSFDRRGYPVVSVKAGYGEWANNYDATVTAGLDQPLLDSLKSVNWRQVRGAADLACGTGRTGVWLKNHGVASIHGVDLTQQMLDIAASKHAHEQCASRRCCQHAASFCCVRSVHAGAGG